MKTLKFFAICAIAAMALTMVSCNRASAPRTNLRTSVDSTSYAWGVNVTANGLLQHLEQMRLLENVSMIEEDFNTRMMVADSLARISLARERRAAIDSVNRINASTLNEFIRGMRRGIDLGDELAEESPYSTGLQIGMQLSQMIAGTNEALFGIDATESLNNNQILAGMIKVLRSQETVISAADAEEMVNREFQRAQEEQMARHEAGLRGQFEEEIAAGAAFLAENARREGVVVLPSGLQYEIIREGTGEKPTETDVVRVHYHGTLIDGTVFDSSMDRQREHPDRDWAAVFGVTDVISGWTEALQLMPVGSKWRLVIPYDLAYGGQDRGIIRPFSALIFDVELLGIE